MSARMVAGRGEGFFFCIYSPGRADVVNFLLLPHNWPRPCHWGCVEGGSHLLLSPRDVYSEGAGRPRWRMTRASASPGRPVPTRGSSCGRPARAPWAAPLFSRLQLRLRKCCQHPARWGRRRQPPPAPHKDDTRHGRRGREGGSGG